MSILCKSTIMLIKKMHLIYRYVCIRMGLNCICPSPDLTDRTPFGIALGYPGLSQHYIFFFCFVCIHLTLLDHQLLVKPKFAGHLTCYKPKLYCVNIHRCKCRVLHRSESRDRYTTQLCMVRRPIYCVLFRLVANSAEL